jgi:hypothetical protein
MTHKPKYMCWYEEEFWADRYVSQMPRQSRHFYRALLQAALFCPTRPCLPTDDTELALYADADPQDWQTHKAAVLHNFAKVTIEGVEVWSHKRLLEQWEKIQKEYSQWSEMGKKSGESRKPKAEPPNHGSAAVQPELNNIGSGSGSGSRSGNGFGLNNNTSNVIEINDAESNSSSVSKPKPSKPATKTTESSDNIDGQAEELVEILHTMLVQRAEVKIPDNYAGLWIPDFVEVLKSYSFEEVRMVVLYSQLPKNQKYFVRAKSICDKFDDLWLQVMKFPANQKASLALWNKAKAGNLPPMKGDAPASKTIAERLRGNCCQECPDGVPAHAPGECPDPDELQAFEAEEDLG